MTDPTKANIKHGLPWWLSAKYLPADAGNWGSVPGSGRIPREENDNQYSLFLPGKSQGQRSLAGYSPWGHERVRHILATKQQQIQNTGKYKIQYTFTYFFIVNSPLVLHDLKGHLHKAVIRKLYAG